MTRPTDAEMAEWERGVQAGLARPREMFTALKSERERADKAQAELVDFTDYPLSDSLAEHLQDSCVWIQRTKDEEWGVMGYVRLDLLAAELLEWLAAKGWTPPSEDR